MKKLSSCISLTSLFVLAYVIASTVSGSFAFVFFLLLICQFSLVWMVIRILKDNYTTSKTFESHFYQDAD